MSSSRKSRRITLYRGHEPVVNYSQHAADSVATALRSIRREFCRNPGLTHAVVMDRAGRTWQVGRNLSHLKVLWLSFRLS